MRQTEYVILGLLNEAPLTGYQIKKYIDIRFRYFWSESYGQIYPTLKSLVGRGLIAEGTTEIKKNRAQTTYRIKPAGLTALKQWLELPVERETIRLEILLKMFFSHLVTPEVMIKHVKEFQEAHEKDLAMIKIAEKEVRSIIERDPNHPYILRVIDFGEKVNGAYLDWCRDTIKFLESMKKGESDNAS